MRAPRPLLALAAAAGLAALSACIYVPRTVSVYDADCEVVTRQMVLDSAQVGAISHCRNDECLAILAAYGVISSVTLVVSGSIVVVGNIVYWFEARRQCLVGPAR